MTFTDPHAPELDRAADILRRSRSLLFITGAGISADSGLPTYRGIGGLYNAEHPDEGIPIEEILSGHDASPPPGTDLEVPGRRSNGPPAARSSIAATR